MSVGPCRGTAAVHALCSWSFAKLWARVQVAWEREERKEGNTTLRVSWWLGVTTYKGSAGLQEARRRGAPRLLQRPLGAVVTVRQQPPPLKCQVPSWFLIHQESQVAEASTYFLAF